MAVEGSGTRYRPGCVAAFSVPLPAPAALPPASPKPAPSGPGAEAVAAAASPASAAAPAAPSAAPAEPSAAAPPGQPAAGGRAADFAPGTTRAGDGDDGAAVAAEVRDEATPPAVLAVWAEELRRLTRREHGVALSAVVFLKPHCLRKASGVYVCVRVWRRRGGR